MLIGCIPIFLSVEVHVHSAMKNKLSGHIQPFSITIIYFQIHYAFFPRGLEEFYIFAVIMEPFQM